MKMTQKRLSTLCFWLAVVAMLVVGRYTYQDYGMCIDEHWERKTAVLNYEYVVETLTDIEVEHPYEESLSEYRERYYGAALQMPMVLMEHLTDFTMPLRDAFLLRHLYTFVLCMGGWICFYLFCKKVFQNSWLALLGMLMVALYPRFWGEQFTNIKDLTFTATCCAAMLGTALCLEHEGKWRYEILAAFLYALCANTRFIGFVFPALLFGYRLIRDLWLEGIPKGEGKTWMRRRLLRYVAQLVLMMVFYFLLSPGSWSNPWKFLLEVFATFSNYNTWSGQVLFLGKWYPGNQLPWYYLLTWILLSAPLGYLALMALGIVDASRELALCAKGKRLVRYLLDEYRYAVFCGVVALIPLVTPIFKEVTLYNAWRHVYYVFPALVVVALFGFRSLWRLLKNRRALRGLLAGLTCLMLIYQVGWTAWNHPFEKVYFNAIGRQFADGLDRDYWYETDYHQLQRILRNDDSYRIQLAVDPYVDRTVINYLPYEQQIRLYCWYNYPPNTEYLIDMANTVEPETFEGFTPVYELRMKDGLLLSTLYIRDEVLQERFGGVYPEQNVS